MTGCSGACTRCGNGEDRCVTLTVVGTLAPVNAAERGFGLIWSQERGYGMFAIEATGGGNRVLRSTRWRDGAPGAPEHEVEGGAPGAPEHEVEGE